MKVFFIILIFFFLSTSLFSQTKIYTTSGNVIECQSVQKKRFGFEYVPINSTDGYNEYLPNTKIDRIEYANGEVEYVTGSSNKVTRKKDPTDFSYLTPHYVSLNIGPSIPFGYFGYNDSYNQGYAYTGINANLDASFYVSGFGIGFTGGYSYAPFQSGQHMGLVNSYLPPSITNLDIKVGGWNNGYAMVGIGYYNEMGRLFLDYKGMIGIIFSYYPTANVTYTDSSGINQHSVFTSEAQGLMYGIQGSIRYYLTRKLSLKGTACLYYGEATFNQLDRKDYQNGQVVTEIAEPSLGSISISTINVTVGIAYTLGK